MDLADIPAAAALLGAADLPSGSAASAAPESARTAPSAATTRQHRGAGAMEPSDTTTAAARPDATTHLYPAAYPAATPVAAHDPNAAMAQHYYAQNLTGFAMPFMPMYGIPMFHAGPPGAFLGGAHMAHAGAAPPLAAIYDLDASAALQNQIAAQFTQATPQQQRTYYEDIRQQLDTAASGLNDDQKQALLRMDPSLSFTMKPLELDSNANIDDSGPPPTKSGLKRARPGSGGATPSGKKKPRKNKMSSSCVPNADAASCDLLNEESPGDSSSSTPTPRATPRGRPPGAAKAANAAGVMLTPSGKKLSMTPQAEEMRARKAKMTWPKGTFIVRLQDVKVRNGRDHIWLVDNHQLLQRYNNESGTIRADGSRVYHKTDRYTGWLCHEGFHYFPLFDQKHILRMDADTVTVLFPDEADLEQAIDYQEQENARRAELQEVEPPNIRPLPPSIRNKPAQLALMQQQQQHQLQQPHAHSSLSTTSTLSMRSGQMPQQQQHRDEMSSLHGQMMMMGRSSGNSHHPVFSASPSCSMTNTVATGAGVHHLPSTSRGFGMPVMPSLSRQDYWGRPEEEAGEVQMGDDVIVRDGRRQLKKEEAEYEEYGDLADLNYSGMP